MIPVEFVSAESMLRGFFFPSPSAPAIATVVFLQGFPGIEGDELICESLAQEKLNVLTFNYRGTFASQGTFSFSNAVADVGAALQYLREPHFSRKYSIDPNEILLGGWSFGSGIVFAGAVRFPPVKKIFAISGRDFAIEAQRIAGDPAYREVVLQNLASIRVPQGPVRYADDILDDLIENQALFEAGKWIPSLLDREILLIGAWDDEVSAIEDHLLPLYRTLKNGGIAVQIHAFLDGHEFSRNKDKLVKVIAGWLGGEPLEAATPPPRFPT